MTSKLIDHRLAEIHAECEERDPAIVEIRAMIEELQERRKQSDELTMWVKRLVRSLKNANPDSKLPREAMGYLAAKGLISVGDILR